jgi:hypothetical protein
MGDGLGDFLRWTIGYYIPQVGKLVAGFFVRDIEVSSNLFRGAGGGRRTRRDFL